MSVNALYFDNFSAADTIAEKWRLSVKTSGAENVFSTLFVLQLNPTIVVPLETNPSRYMTLFHAGTNAGSGLGVFLKYNTTISKYQIGVRYNVKGGSTWTEVPSSFTPLTDWGKINDPYLILLSYNVTSKTTPTFTFAIVNFATSGRTSPDFSLLHNFVSTEITATGQWGFGSIPMSITSQYGLVTTNSYNSYVLAGTYITYLQAWTIQVPITSSSSGVYAMFNTDGNQSIYSLMSRKLFITAGDPGTASFIFQLHIPNGGILAEITNTAKTSAGTLVSLTPGTTAFPPLPGFGMNSDATYISVVQNGVSCILKGIKILTDAGYKLIEDLSQDDKLINKDGKIINIIKITNFNAKPDYKNIPIIIKKGQYGAFEDLYISKGHAIYLNGEFIRPGKLNLPEVENTYKPISYYHIETDNYLTDTIIANGVVLETYGGYREEFFTRNIPKYINKNGNRILL